MTFPSLFPDEPAPAPSPDRAPAPAAQTQSLYRKYRPQSFEQDELVGQEHIVRTLRNAIQRDRIAHAYLFCGPRGTGKTTTARLLAKAVNCLNPDIMKRPCNECAACVAIASNATADVIEIDAASNRGIDDIRDLRERVKYAPSQLKTKFYIIDEAHQITGAAANAFLKTLEEPPPHTKFVLATTDPEELLPTIVSRCQRFDFRRIGLDAMTSRLRTVALAEGIEVDDDALTAIARNATGSLRDALGLLDQLAVYGESEADAGGPIGVDTVLRLLGVSRNDRVERLVEALASKDASLALGTVNEAIEAGEDPRQLNRQLVAYLRVLLHQRAGESRDADARAKAFAARFDLHELSRLARVFSETDYKIRHSPYAQLPLEVALVDAIASPAPSAATVVVAPSAPAPRQPAPSARPDEQELLAAPPSTALRDKLRGGGRGGHLQVVGGTDTTPPIREPEPAPYRTAPVTPGPVAPPAGQAPSGAVTVDQLADLWPKIRADVKAVNRRVEALLASIDPVAVNGNQVVLVAAYEFHRKRMNEESVRSVVEDVLSRIFKMPLTVTCLMRGEELAASSAGFAPRPAPVVAERPPAVDARPISEPSPGSNLDEQRLQAAKNIFDGEEIPSE